MPKSYNSAGKSTRGMAEGRRSQLVSMGLIGIAVIVAFTCSCPTAPVWELRDWDFGFGGGDAPGRGPVR